MFYYGKSAGNFSDNLLITNRVQIPLLHINNLEETILFKLFLSGIIVMLLVLVCVFDVPAIVRLELCAPYEDGGWLWFLFHVKTSRWRSSASFRFVWPLLTVIFSVLGLIRHSSMTVDILPELHLLWVSFCLCDIWTEDCGSSCMCTLPYTPASPWLHNTYCHLWRALSLAIRQAHGYT